MNKQSGFSLLPAMIIVVLVIGSVSAYFASTVGFKPPVSSYQISARKILMDSEIIKAAINSCDPVVGSANPVDADQPTFFPESVSAMNRNAKNVCSMTCPGETQTVWKKLSVPCPTYQPFEGLESSWTYFYSINTADCKNLPTEIGMKALDASATTDSIHYIALQTTNSSGSQSSGNEAIGYLIDLMTGARYSKDIESAHQVRSNYQNTSKTMITAENAGQSNPCVAGPQTSPGGLRILFRVN